MNDDQNQQKKIELKVNVKSIQQILTFQIPNKQMFEDLCPEWKHQNPIDIEEIADLIGIYNFFNSIIILIRNEFSEPQYNSLDDTVAKLSLQSGYCSQMIPQLLEYNDTNKLLRLYTNIDHSLSENDTSKSNIENYLSSNYSKLLDDPQSDLISIDVQCHHRILSKALKQNNFPYSKFAQFIKKHIQNKPEIVFLLSQLCISNFDETDVACLKQIDNIFAYFNHSDLYQLYEDNKKLQSENEKLKKENKKLQSKNNELKEENKKLQNQQNNDILLNLQHINAKMNNQEIYIQNLKNGFDSLQQTQINNVNAINKHFSDSNNQISQLTEKFNEIKMIGQEIQNNQVNQMNFNQKTNQIINEINQTTIRENEKIQNLSQQNNNILKNLENKMNNHETSIQNVKQGVDSLKTQITDVVINQKLSDLRNQITQLKNEVNSGFNDKLNKLTNIEQVNQTNFDQIKTLMDHINQIKSSENETIQILNQQNNNLKIAIQGSRDEILSHVDYVENVPHQHSNQFNGILNKLKQINSIEIQHGAEVYGDYKATNLIDYSNSTFFGTLNHGNWYKNWLEFDFRNKRVVLSGYEIKAPTDFVFKESSQNVTWAGTPKSWKIQGSNDQEKWETIDTQENRSELNGQNNVGYFECKTPTHKGYRYIRFVQNDCWDEPCNPRRPYDIFIAKFELYGKILEKYHSSF